ncbi:MAG TPA: plastocyanin/azurin family copper-binding protein [Candidatus Polarisedimenticolia bacterium]
MRNPTRSGSMPGAIVLALLLFARPALAVEPGVDIATPRVAISSTSNAFSFNPATLTIEQGDHVRWIVLTGTTLAHTTTSGNPCLASGLWNASLTSTSPSFTRQFLETPQVLPFFCSPHCGLGMVGQVTVTTLINVIAVDSAGTLKLSWTGGGGSYQIFRSSAPAFPASSTVVLPPDAGDAGTIFSDPNGPAPGTATFYLVMNKF